MFHIFATYVMYLDVRIDDGDDYDDEESSNQYY